MKEIGDCVRDVEMMCCVLQFLANVLTDFSLDYMSAEQLWIEGSDQKLKRTEEEDEFALCIIVRVIISVGNNSSWYVRSAEDGFL